MKKLVLIAMFLGCSFSVFAAAPSDELIERYVSAARIKEINDAQIKGFVDQMAPADSRNRAEIERYLTGVMGWTAVRGDYFDLVRKTYSAEELTAALQFFESSIGQAITAKNPQFESGLSAITARNTQKAFAADANSSGQKNRCDKKDTKSEDEEAPVLKLGKFEELTHKGTTSYVGRVTNTSTKSAHGVQVEVNLFHRNKFVDQCGGYVAGAIQPGASRYVKVLCGTRQATVAAHDRYEVNVYNGF